MARAAVVLIIILVGAVFAQPTQEWVARYNGSGDWPDVGHAIALDSSGSICVTGNSWGLSARFDYATVKYDTRGNQQWAARYVSPGAKGAMATAIAADLDGNVVVTGYDDDYVTVSYDSSGNERWIRRYNGSGIPGSEAHAIAVDDSGSVYVTGSDPNAAPARGSSYATIKYSRGGDQQWVARYSRGRAQAIALDDLGNVYVTGYCEGVGTNDDYATVKYNSAGVQQWVARYHGPNVGSDEACAVAADRSGSVYVTGFSKGSGMWDDDDYATIKYDSAGIQQWVARYDGPAHGLDMATALVVDRSGNVYVTGSSLGTVTFYDCLTIKYNPAGVQQWTARYNGPGNYSDWMNAAVLDDSGNLYVTGQSIGLGTGFDYVTIKYNPEGVEQWVMRYDGLASDGDMAEGIVLDRSGSVFVFGTSLAPNADDDFVTIKYSQKSLGCEDDRGRAAEGRGPADVSLAIAQNPTRGAVTVRYALPAGETGTLEILDATGRVLRFCVLPASSARSPHFLLLTPHCPPGVLFLRLSSAGRTATAKLVLLQ